MTLNGTNWTMYAYKNYNILSIFIVKYINKKPVLSFQFLLQQGDEGILKLLDVSNDIAFRLSHVSKLAGIPLHCEISSVNITISSSYWDQVQGPNAVVDCDLKEIESEALLRFPSEKSGSLMGNVTSYILLPKEIKENAYKAGGVFIAASKLVRQLLPGYNNRHVSITYRSKLFLLY